MKLKLSLRERCEIAFRTLIRRQEQGTLKLAEAHYKNIGDIKV